MIGQGDQITEANAGELEAGEGITGANVELLRVGDWLTHKYFGAAQYDADPFGKWDETWSFLGRPDADGWIEWSGGENPVPGLWIKFRIRGFKRPGSGRELSDELEWRHGGATPASDIIAYRPAPSAVETPSAAVGGEGAATDQVAKAIELLTAWSAPDPFVPSAEYGTSYDKRQIKKLSDYRRLSPWLIQTLRALQPSSAADAKPVAWRWKREGWGADVWEVRDTPLNLSKCEDIVAHEPLYAQPQPSQQAGTEGLSLALQEAADAVEFFDRVKAASQDEKIAVGQDHWIRLEAALRALAALKTVER